VFLGSFLASKLFRIFPFTKGDIVVAAINTSASRFLTLVAHQFDQRHNPQITTLPAVSERPKEGHAKPLPTDGLPKDLQAVICSAVPGFTSWLNASHFLAAPLTDNMLEWRRKAAIELSAKELLVRYQQPLGYVQPYSEQLLIYVFQEAFNRTPGDTREDKRNDIIAYAKETQSYLNGLPLTWCHIRYTVGNVAIAILDNMPAKIALTYLSYHVGKWVQPRLYRLLGQTVIPKGVNLLINHSHIYVIKVVSGGLALIQYAYYHSIKASIGFWATKMVTQNINPRFAQIVTVVETVAFLPSKIIDYLMMSPLRIMTSSWKIQASLAGSFKNAKEPAKAQALEEGAKLAHRAWMELMQVDARFTLKAPERTQ
jgi:hypothetical protein